MLAILKLLKPLGFILWGIILFLAISNQKMTLEHISATKVLPLKGSEYQFSQSGKKSEEFEKYRIDRTKGKILFAFSDAGEFTNILSLNFKSTKHINFEPRFHRTKSCILGEAPDRYSLFVTVGDVEYYFLQERNARDSIDLQIPKNAQVGIRVQALENSCGAVQVIITRVQMSTLLDYLLINGLWLAFIVLMLISHRVFLPLLSGAIFYFYLEADELYSSISSWEQIGLYSSFAISSGLIISLILSVGSNNPILRFLTRVVSLFLIIVVCFIPITAIVFQSVFDVLMDKYDWFAVLQTDLTEAYEFITVFAPDVMVYTIFSGFALVLFILWSSSRAPSRFMMAHGVLLLLCMPFGVLFFDQSPNLNMSSAAISQYREDAELARISAETRNSQIGSIHAVKQKVGEVYIIVSGESANRNHFSMYGYPRITTPLLSARRKKGGFVQYKQAYSGGVSTRGSLGWALTSATVKNGSINVSPSVIEVLNAAGFETYWLKNGSTVVSSSILSLIANQATHRDRLSSIYGQEDGKLLAEVDKALANDSSNNTAIFLRTQGSHVAYCQRLPKSDSDKWMLGDDDYYNWLIPDKYESTHISDQANCYDGSIKYTDYFVDEIIKRVERTGKVASVIYFSDHGDEIVEGTAHMGGAPTYGVFSVPMFLWFSDSYQKLYPQNYTNIVSNSGRVFVNDVIFDSLLGLMSVETEQIRAENDISNIQFQDRKWVYRGRKTVYDNDNYIYYTPKNIKSLKEMDHPFHIYLGPLEHPFHLSWVTRGNQYNYIALSSTYQDGQYNLNSSLFRERIVSLRTILKYLQFNSTQKLMLRVKREGAGDDAEKMANQLLALLEEYEIDKSAVTITSNDYRFLNVLTGLDVRVTPVVSGSAVLEGDALYDSIAIDLKDPVQLKTLTSSQPIDAWITSCHINSCGEEFFQRIHEHAGELNIRNLIVPMFDL